MSLRARNGTDVIQRVGRSAIRGLPEQGRNATGEAPIVQPRVPVPKNPKPNCDVSQMGKSAFDRQNAKKWTGQVVVAGDCYSGKVGGTLTHCAGR